MKTAFIFFLSIALFLSLTLNVFLVWKAREDCRMIDAVYIERYPLRLQLSQTWKEKNMAWAEVSKLRMKLEDCQRKEK